MKKKSYSFSNNNVKCFEEHILWSIKTGNEKSSIFFLKLKRHYQNGFIQSPYSRYKELGDGLTRNTYKRRLDAIIKLGWAIPTKNGITLIAADKLPVLNDKERHKRCYIPNNENLTVVYFRNMLHVISERVQKCKVKLSKLHPYKGQAIIQIGGKLTKTTHDLRRDVSMSITTLADKLGKSTSTALRQLRKARKLGIINTYSRYARDPNAKTTYIVFEGLRYKRVANSFQTSVSHLKDRIVVSKMTIDERITFMYCNDCF